MDNFGDKIADLCHKYFEKSNFVKGKPQSGKEWTVLTCIVKEDSDFKVISLGTGTKCLGESETSRNGDLGPILF